MAKNKNNQSGSSGLEIEAQNIGSGFAPEVRDEIPADDFPQESAEAFPGEERQEPPPEPLKEEPPSKPETRTPAGKTNVYHPGLKGQTIIAGSEQIAFDAEGFAVVDPALMKYLLSIPGYTKEE